MKEDRRDYSKGELKLSDLQGDPLDIVQEWVNRAKSNELDPTAFVLSTSVDGQPNSRVVLLKEIRGGELVFFTNYNSSKGRELAQNPKVSLNFFIPSDERQIRILGTAAKVSESESDDYFYSRPYESQVGAVVSNQSATLESRASLDDAYESALKLEQNPKRPENWGGYAITPFQIEFWQGRPSRLHDRFQFSLIKGNWEVKRLYP